MNLPAWREAIESGDPNRMQAARRALEDLIRSQPTAFEPLDAEAQVLHALGEDALAERLLDEFLLYDPGSTAAAIRLAWLRHVSGRRDDAVAEILATLGRDPSSLQARIYAIQWLVEEGQAQRAEQIGTEGLEIHGDNGSLLLWLGLAQAASGHTDKAVSTLARAHEVDPGNEEIARDYARILLSVRRPADAFAVLEPFGLGPEPSPKTWLTAARAAHAARLPRKGSWFLHRLATDPRCDSDQLQHDVIKAASECLGGTSAENWAFSLIETGVAVDALGVELLESCAAQMNRTKVEHVFVSASRAPGRYQRTIARFLTTFSELTTTHGVVAKWVAANGHEIQLHTPIWAGVGAWHLARRKYAEAVDHLTHWPGRRGVKPWMILLLGRALEALGRHSEANAQYRAALQLPPDHSEPALRTRLGFNLALEGLAANGHLIITDLSTKGTQYVSAEDRARSAAIEGLFAIGCADSPDDARNSRNEALELITELRQGEAASVVSQIERLYIRRADEMIEDPRTFARNR